MSRRFFDALWPLAMVLLPWQTRWFRDASLAGWPWEQGRWSIYASWFVLVAVMVCAARLVQRGASSSTKQKWCLAVVLLVTNIGLAMIFAGNPQERIAPVMQWMLQVGMLSMFIWSVWTMRVAWREIAMWFVVSLVPHMLFGLWQALTQNVSAMKWLGIAAHLPATLGTSVVEVGGERLLRIYGGFPHPNIFGGWLALGVVVSLWLAATASSRRGALIWSAASAMATAVLVLTFARGAWIAAMVGATISAVILWRRPGMSISRRFAAWAVAAGVVAALVVGVFEQRALLARFDPAARLETRSIDARARSLADGLGIFRTHPFFGAGPNAELLELAAAQATEPLEPPHNVFLLILADLGAFGGLTMAMFVGWMIRTLRLRALLFLVPLGVLGLFDHYLWSTWSGQCLLAIMVLLSLTIADVPVYPHLDKEAKSP